MMDRLDAMALFVTAVDEGSLAAAARRHGRSPATLTRAIALLESAAGETLLLRSTRRLRLTTAGERQVAIWREVLTKLAQVAPESQAGVMRGSIALTAPELFGRLRVLPVLERYLALHPGVSTRLLLVNRLVDLTGEGFDLAIRLAPLPDSALTAIRLGEVHTLLCASPDYVARKGLPGGPHDLVRHECIGLNAEGDAELWSFRSGERNGGRLRSLRVRTRLSVSGAGAAIDAGLRGRGLIRVRSYQVASDIAAGRLLRLLSEHEPPPTPVNLLFHSARASGGVLRGFIDHAVPALRQVLRDIGSAVPNNVVGEA